MINLKVLKKWIKMLNGKSIFHVQQTEGKCFSLQEVKGYYNDLTGKISEDTILDSNGIPINTTVSGINTYFPITIFQYGLGLYDLYLLKHNNQYLEKFMNIADWALSNQKANGMWECMSNIGDTKHLSQSSMCQSEGASVLIRAFVNTKDKKYYNAATNAINFMLLSVKQGGTCYYRNENQPIFQEYVSEDNLSVLNGWIFSIFGLFDYTLINKDKKYKTILDNTVKCLASELDKYDRKFWSNYDQKKTIASPAYNNLHIKQLRLLKIMFGNDKFGLYADKFEKYENKKIYKYLAMIIKLRQKIFKSKYYDINANLIK